MKLLDWRKYRNLSQAELATNAGVSKTTVNRLENDPNHRVRGAQLKKIATALGIDIKDLDRDPPIAGVAVSQPKPIAPTYTEAEAQAEQQRHALAPQRHDCACRMHGLAGDRRG